MTAASIGAFAYGAVIGWLGILFVAPSAWSNWRPFAFAIALYAAGVSLWWWLGGLEGAEAAALGVSAGALALLSIRFNFSRVIQRQTTGGAA